MRARDATCAAPYEASAGAAAAAVADAVRETYEATGAALRSASHAPRSAESRAALATSARGRREAAARSALVDGDYCVVAHVIEARELHGENFDGTSDPFVEVTVCGRTAATRAFDGVTSAIWDEKLFFRLDGVLGCPGLSRHRVTGRLHRLCVAIG